MLGHLPNQDTFFGPKGVLIREVTLYIFSNGHRLCNNGTINSTFVLITSTSNSGGKAALCNGSNHTNYLVLSPLNGRLTGL